jgi:hypothetical protein
MKCAIPQTVVEDVDGENCKLDNSSEIYMRSLANQIESGLRTLPGGVVVNDGIWAGVVEGVIEMVRDTTGKRVPSMAKEFRNRLSCRLSATRAEVGGRHKYWLNKYELLRNGPHSLTLIDTISNKKI